MTIFSGNTNKDFAKRICRLHLKKSLGNADIKKFANGEIYVTIHFHG